MSNNTPVNNVEWGWWHGGAHWYCCGPLNGWMRGDRVERWVLISSWQASVTCPNLDPFINVFSAFGCFWLRNPISSQLIWPSVVPTCFPSAYHLPQPASWPGKEGADYHAFSGNSETSCDLPDHGQVHWEELEKKKRSSVRNGHPSNSGRWIPTLSQSRQRELVRVSTGFEYTTYIYSTWSVHYFPMVIMWHVMWPLMWLPWLCKSILKIGK